MPDSIDFKRECIESGLPSLSVRRQCELLGLNRSSWYYRPAGESAENLEWMRRIDEQYLKTPCYGSRKMARELGISRSRAQRLMRLMDNVFVERLWRTLKYECIYLHDYATVRALEAGLARFFLFYNEERLHAALDYLTPAAMYAA